LEVAAWIGSVVSIFPLKKCILLFELGFNIEVHMNKVKLAALAASVSFAIAFIFSCSGDGEGDKDNSIVGEGESSSSSVEDNSSVKKDKISGVSQKGPFIKGSTATLYELNDKFAQTGRSFRDIITDDKGSFEIKNVELVSPYAVLEADGFYRNEITGTISAAPIKLYAIADIREKNNININLLTHLEYYRVQKLVEGGKPLREAKKQAQGEILAVFNISGEFENSEDMSIFGISESDAALLAISILMQGNLSEGQFTERLTDFSIGFRESGIWGNEAAKTAMADWAAGSNESGIKNNILGWELSSAVPDFGKYVRNYWHTNYSLGVCDADLQDSIKSVSKGVYICKGNAWVLATEYERDTYQWVCSTEGEIKDGQASGRKYICKGDDWAFATEYEIDTYQWNCIAEGEIKKGNVSQKDYVCQNNAWRVATAIESDIQLVCLASNENMVKKSNIGTTYYYICKNKAWRLAMELEYDTYEWVCSEGEIKDGQVSSKKYICKGNDWALATEYEIDTYQWNCIIEGEIKDGQASGRKYICKSGKWQIPKYIEVKCFESNSCLTFKDARDNQSYFSVVIGEQIWMAENLNFNAEGSKCYDNADSYCNVYGRLYDWEIAISACPDGWHLPTKAEWDILTDLVGGSISISMGSSETEGKHLKATSGWYNWNGNDQYDDGNGLDTYGFAALPGGYYIYSDYSFFSSEGQAGNWWTASEPSGYVYSHPAYIRLMNSGSEGALWAVSDKKQRLYSVRCIQDVRQ
jgi:uncharacterized protein (TIGR02145 family)